MTDEPVRPRVGNTDLQNALRMLAAEQRKLAEFQQKVNAASTVVESPDKMVTASFDGRGVLVKLAFNNTKYRSMAPAELATVLLSTLQRGRDRAFAQVGEFAGREVMPGVPFSELAAGNVDISEMVGNMLGSAFNPAAIDAALNKRKGTADG